MILTCEFCGESVGRNLRRSLIQSHIIREIINSYHISMHMPTLQHPYLYIIFGHMESDLTTGNVYSNQHAYFYNGIFGKKASKGLSEIACYLQKDLALKYYFRFGIKPKSWT